MVKIMSYNIHHGVGEDGKLNLKRIAKIITQSGADIVGLQEVDNFFDKRSDFKDQSKELARLTGYDYAFGANVIKESSDALERKGEYGNAILSQYPIIEYNNTYLNSFRQEQRGVLRAKIDLGNSQLNFYCTHLGLKSDERISQVDELSNLIVHNGKPHILVGDFNMEEQNVAYKMLLEKTNSVDSFQRMKDANSYSASNPIERIDYIFLSSEVEYRNAYVINAMASDHLPIMAEIIIT